MDRWLVIYDIHDPRRLVRVAKTMEQFGVRVQKSVFEANLDRWSLSVLKLRLKPLLAPDDSVLYIPLCVRCRQKKRMIGVKAEEMDDGEGFKIL